MNFYAIASGVYDILDITYFKSKAGNPRSAIREVIVGEDIKVLDMCCGTLSNTISSAQVHKNAKFYGIDISKQMLKKARRKIRSNEIDNIRLKCADCADRRFYFCDKKTFFRENHFEICNVIHCSYSSVTELKKMV